MGKKSHFFEKLSFFRGEKGDADFSRVYPEKLVGRKRGLYWIIPTVWVLEG